MGRVFSLVILVTRVCMSLQLLLPGLLGTSHHRAREAQWAMVSKTQMSHSVLGGMRGQGETLRRWGGEVMIFN